MLLSLLLACSGHDRDNSSFGEEEDDGLFDRTDFIVPATRYEVRVCVILADDSPLPDRLVFLYKTPRDNTDMQAELFWDDLSRVRWRCGRVSINLVSGSDDIPVTMDYMPSQNPPTIRELRVYRDVPDWTPKHPHATAAVDARGNYVFTVNLVSPADNASAILLR